MGFMMMMERKLKKLKREYRMINIKKNKCSASNNQQ
jgi:hypothetical protein